MNPHIEATLREIEDRIAKLQTLAEGLRSLDSAQTAPSPNGPGKIRAIRDNPRNSRKASLPSKGLKLIDAMRDIIHGMSDKFTIPQLGAAILAKYPTFEKRLSALSVNLIDMSARGELHRFGAGRGALYSKAKLKGARSSKEEAYQQFRSSIASPAIIE